MNKITNKFYINMYSIAVTYFLFLIYATAFQPKFRYITFIPIESTSWSYQLCENHNNTFHISHFDISPDPPQTGQPLTVTLSGYLNKHVMEGSVLELEVNYHRIRLIKKTMDICQELVKVKNAPEYCPIQPGEKVWDYTLDMQQKIPSGKYNIYLNLRDQNENQIWCANIKLEM
jgi:hypothetical protein